MCAESIAWCDLGLAGIAAGKDFAGSAKLRTSRAMNGAVDTAAAEQRLVGGIDDGVDLKLGDVAFDDLDVVEHGVLRRVTKQSSSASFRI